MSKYFTYGLNIHSDLELPLWPAVGDHADQTPDIVIKCLESRPLSRELPETGCELRVCPEGGELVFDGIGSIRLQPGWPVQVLAEPVPVCSEALLAHFLSGSALALAIHYHGFLPLHGCALRINSKTAVFMGSSGIGKSTLCAALCKMGSRIITDDISPVCWLNGQAHVMPGYPRTKLNPDIADTLGIAQEELVPLHELHQKVGWLRPEDRFNQPQPIDSLFFLGIGEREVLPVTGLDAYSMIQRNAMPSQWGFEGGKDHFLHCGRLIREVSAYAFIRERDLGELMDQADWISRFIDEAENGEKMDYCPPSR